MDHFNLDVVRVWKLFTLVEAGYHSTNPYHNSIHATDVTQAMHCFLQEEKIKMHLTPLEIMSSLIAAVTHDLDHPGVNQPFLIATSNHLAALYENTSVLENHHWRSAIGCLLESNVAEQLGACRLELEQQISSLILATDITRQQEFLSRFKRYLDHNLLDMHHAEDRHFILQIALKCADISNPCRPWDVSRKWSQKVCEEFFRQGDYERQLNLPVTSLCDRHTTSIPKIQAGFFRFVVLPLFEEWHRFLKTDLSTLIMGHLKGNQSRWDALIQQELAEETRTEISETEVLDEEVGGSSEEEAVAGADDITASVELLLPDSPYSRRPSLPYHNDETDSVMRVGRRHSVPLSVPCPPPITRTIIRRESLPMGEHHTQRRYPSGPILHVEEEEEVRLGQSSLSLLSTCSSGPHHSSGGASGHDSRPVSSETLLPEPSITSITTSMEASRLSSVLHGGGNGTHTSQAPSRFLTRQQTFPPLQPYVRIRYMSTTAEMATCTEDVAEVASCSNSPSSSASDHASAATESHQVSDLPSVGTCSRNGCGTPNGKIRTLRDNGRTCTVDHQCVNEKIVSVRSKREQTDAASDKAAKIAKISDSWTTQHSDHKENVDPQHIGSDADLDSSCSKTSHHRNTPQGLARRRGSAPVDLLNRSDDCVAPVALTLRGGGDRFLRRGSVPIDMTRQSILRPLGLKENTVCLPSRMPRRSSLPYDTTNLSSLLDPCTVPTGDKGGSESIVKDVRYRRLDPVGNISTRPLDTSPNIINQQHNVNVRRGSVPADFNSELRFSNGLGRNGNNSKSRIRKKILCRRSSGGPEMFTDSGPEAFGEGVTWQQWHHELLSRRTAEPALAKRRGSLPIEMLATTHSVRPARRTCHNQWKL